MHVLSKIFYADVNLHESRSFNIWTANNEWKYKYKTCMLAVKVDLLTAA